MIYGILLLIVFIVIIFLYVPLDDIKEAVLPVTFFILVSFLLYKFMGYGIFIQAVVNASVNH